MVGRLDGGLSGPAGIDKPPKAAADRHAFLYTLYQQTGGSVSRGFATNTIVDFAASEAATSQRGFKDFKQ
jgi:hypothetical protein